ncbi:ABC transporter permease [Hydrogenophaga borbori]|uniref:ABC transporter permease n=1 Tax=Hydrogenophaga borbori TaxID=2294117 RepID=UPI00301BC2B4
MRFARAFTQAWSREWARLRASPWDLAMLSWVPLAGVALLWWLFSAGLPTQLPIGVVDQDHSAMSRQLVRFLDATPGLRVARQLPDPHAAGGALTRGELHAVVLIPSGFSREVKLGRAAQLTLLHNAQLGTHSGLIQRDVRTVVGTLSAGVEMAARQKRGEPARGVRVAMEPIKADMVTLFNPSLNYEQFLAAALIPALLHILAMTAGAWAVGRELRDGTVWSWLGVAPSPAATAGALLGKLAPAWLLLLGVASAGLLWLTGGRGWHPAGHLSWVWLALAALLALSIGLGALVASATASLRTALSATGLITAPAFAFSGVGFPLQSMPAGARAWAEALPYTHYIRLQMEQLQMGAPVSLSAPTLAVFGLATAALLAGCVWPLMGASRYPHRWGGR